MFYEPTRHNHGLPHDPIKALVAPRPIGWISTIDSEGRANLAPYSFFNLVGAAPPVVAFSSYDRKDSQNNAETTGEFVCNIASAHLIDAVNQSSKPVAADCDEFELTGLTKQASRLISPPRVKESPAHLECIYLKSVPIEDRTGKQTASTLILGEVVGVHVSDDVINPQGLVDTLKLNPLTRMGYMDYGLLGAIETRARP